MIQKKSAADPLMSATRFRAKRPVFAGYFKIKALDLFVAVTLKAEEERILCFREQNLFCIYLYSYCIYKDSPRLLLFTLQCRPNWSN